MKALTPWFQTFTFCSIYYPYFYLNAIAATLMSLIEYTGWHSAWSESSGGSPSGGSPNGVGRRPHIRNSYGDAKVLGWGYQTWTNITRVRLVRFCPNFQHL